MTETYAIRDAAATCGLTPHTLRWYERIGLLDPIERGSDGRRRYSRRDLDWLQLLIHLRSTGMPVEQMRQYAELVRAGDGNELDRLNLFEEHRKRVVEAMEQQAECLAVLNRKIERYREIVKEKT